MSNYPSAYISLYGSVAVVKEFCPSCRRHAFVIDSQLQCCGRLSREVPQAMKREVTAEMRRRKPASKTLEALLIEQDYRCAYCERRLGSLVYRRNKPVKLRIHWDHAVPFAYSQNNRAENLVAACHVC